MIISYQDIRDIRPIAENVLDEKRMRPYIEEADKLYLLPLIGAWLHKDIEDNRNEYDFLFNGGYYDDNKKHLTGLREAMGYLSYSRFIRNQNVNTTAFGVVIKKADYSEPADDRTITRVANDAEKIGQEYLHQCIEYLRYIGKIDSCRVISRKRKFRKIGR